MSVLVEPPTAFIKIAGRAAVEGARDFRALVERLHGQGVSRFCLDLSECLLMDSTFSGVLAGLATRLGPELQDGCQRFALANPNARVTELLDSLGVLELTTVLSGDAVVRSADSGEEVELNRPARHEATDCCLEAHRLLTTLKPENAARFRPLIEMLERQSGTVSE